MEKRKLIEELQYCAGQCSRCYDACMMSNNPDEFGTCMELNSDCADICRLTAGILERKLHSGDGEHFLKFCAEICRLCAQECQKHDSEPCEECAQACTKCAEECLQHQPVF